MTRSSGVQVPPGFRDSVARALGSGEVVASTYAIRDEIARTETGVVFEARDMLLDRPVAFKLAWRDPGMPSLVLEARRCASVRDPCAVAIHGMGNHNGTEYVVAERVTGTLLREVVTKPLHADQYLPKLRTMFAAVTRAHEAGIAVGDLSGATVLVDPDGRMVLGRLSLSQVPAFGPLGRIVAPELIRGEVEPHDPAAAEAIDLYGLGCLAFEMATGKPPFAAADPTAELHAHGHVRPPSLADLRADLPSELFDLVDWLLAKRPEERPRSAKDVLMQLDATIDRAGSRSRPIRVLIVEDDSTRARWLWSLARRAHAAAIVEIASEGTDAAHKLNRDHPELVFIDAGLRGVMNALELCMYARGLDSDLRSQFVLIGEVAERDRLLFSDASVPFLPDDLALPTAVIDRVREAATMAPRRRKPRTTISG